MASESKEALAARICYLIDDLLCDPALPERERTALLRVRSQFVSHATRPTPAALAERRASYAR